MLLNEAGPFDDAPDFQSSTFVQMAGADFLVPSGRASVAVVDLNNDGRKDLLVGNNDGQLKYLLNTGTDVAPTFNAIAALIADGSPVGLEGTPRSRPFVGDADADGDADILMGSSDGRIRLYRGTNMASETGSIAGFAGQAYTHMFELTSDVDLAPQVVEVLVRGADWSPSFMNYLAGHGQGNGGYAIPVGSGAQLAPIPWINVDQVIVRFNEDVSIDAQDVALLGLNRPNAQVADFSYDADSFTATITLTEPLTADKWLLSIGDAVTDQVDNPLDGEWLNPAGPGASSGSTFPSGDGFVGGAFQFRLNVLPGDVNHTGVVLSDDLIQVRNAQFQSTGSLQFAPAFDINGSGVILSDDTVMTRNNQFQAIPDGEHDLAPSGGFAPNSAPQSASAALSLDEVISEDESFTGQRAGLAAMLSAFADLLPAAELRFESVFARMRALELDSSDDSAGSTSRELIHPRRGFKMSGAAGVSRRIMQPSGNGG